MWDSLSVLHCHPVNADESQLHRRTSQEPSRRETEVRAIELSVKQWACPKVGLGKRWSRHWTFDRWSVRS